MLLIATGLIVLGGVAALAGQMLFRILLPIVGFIAGLMVGFGGVQGVFGTGAVSLSIAIIMAIVVGVIMAVLSYMFYHIAIVVLITILGASAFTYLGVALGLGDNGFLLFLLGLAGGVMGFMVSAATELSALVVIYATAYFGVAYVLAGVFLAFGDFSVDQLHEQGIVPAIIDVVDQSFLWLFVWIGGAIMAAQVQMASLRNELLDSGFAYMDDSK